MLKALYNGKLCIGEKQLDCFVLDDKNNTRVLSNDAMFKAFDRISRGKRERDSFINKNMEKIQLPPFMASKALEPFINQEINELIQPIEFLDRNNRKRIGYKAELLNEICILYVQLEIDGKSTPNQEAMIRNAKILLSAFSKIGIIALIDEASGFQKDRKYNALRGLLELYLSEKPTVWLKQFPDDFFYELDRLYKNKATISNSRPLYYGKFINKYVYEIIENGEINPKLQELYKKENKKYRKHQHLTDKIGKPQLQIQIGKIMGLMQVSPNLQWFKNKIKKQNQLSLFNDLDEYDEKNNIY